MDVCNFWFKHFTESSILAESDWCCAVTTVGNRIMDIVAGLWYFFFLKSSRAFRIAHACFGMSS